MLGIAVPNRNTKASTDLGLGPLSTADRYHQEFFCIKDFN